MSLQAAILASLLTQDTCSGYDLAKHYNTCVGTVWQVPHQQVYRELRKMELLGWVQSQAISRKGQLSKKLYCLQDLGKEKLIEWMQKPSEPAAKRDELMVKLFVGHLVQPAVLLADIERHQQAHQTKLDYLENIQSTYFSDPKTVPAEKRCVYLVLLQRVGEERHWIDWCHQAKAFLKQS